MEQEQITFLDVTTLPPAEKHPTIFRLFDALEADGILELANDHDPRPLYYQMLAERGNVFSWTYLEQGPVQWRVQIQYRPTATASTTIGDIVRDDYRKALYLKERGIDFCCGGKRSLEEACNEKQLDPVEIRSALDALSVQPGERQLPYDEWPAAFLADHIVQTHHRFVRKTIPDLRFYASKVYRVHGDTHPELRQIADTVQALTQELSAHMEKEERVLFPYIHQLESGGHMHAAFFASVRQPIGMMEMEHEDAGALMAELRRLTDQYTPPADACNSYRLLYQMLKAFEDDLHLHVHLENNILFPKAISLEQMN